MGREIQREIMSYWEVEDIGERKDELHQLGRDVALENAREEMDRQGNEPERLRDKVRRRRMRYST